MRGLVKLVTKTTVDPRVALSPYMPPDSESLGLVT